jgi:hypothetical protein
MPLRALLAQVEAHTAKFCEMRDYEMKDGRDEPHDESWKLRAQYFQGRIESLVEVKKMIFEAMSKTPREEGDKP